MHTLPKPFEMPFDLFGLDCTMLVEVEAYYPETPTTYHEPGHGEHIEFSVDTVTVTVSGMTHTLKVSDELQSLLAHSAEIIAECREQLIEANQPPEYE